VTSQSGFFAGRLGYQHSSPHGKPALPLPKQMIGSPNQNGISAALQSHVNLTICPKLIWSVGIHQMFPIYGNISNSTQIA